MHRTVGSAVVALAAAATALVAAPAAVAAPPSWPVGELPSEVAAAVAEGPVEVLVSYDTGPAGRAMRATSADGAPTEETVRATASAFAASKRGALARAGVAEVAAEVVEDYPHLPVQLVRASSEADLERIAADPAVTGIALPTTYRPTATPNLEQIRQPAAVAAGHTGAGTSVAVLDTGLNPSFAGGLFGNCSGGPGTGTCRIDFHQNVDGTVFVEKDLARHGTNVASVIATVAPQAHLWVYGVFFQHGGELITSSAVVLSALDHLVANAAVSGVRAVNLSLGDEVAKEPGTCPGSSLTSVFSTLRSLQIVPVVAAGNQAHSSGAFSPGLPDPACVPGAVSVGAVYPSSIPGPVSWGGGLLGPGCTDFSPVAGRIACFSQTSPVLSLLAPGVGIQGGGTTLSGTSQAAPHVAGAVALLVDANPGATTARIVDALVSTGPLVTDTRTVPASQRRLLDVDAATRQLEPVPVQRIQGADRLATALATSQVSFPTPDSAGAVVLASSENYADGLAGTPLAVDKGAPLLLTTPTSLRADVLAEVQRVLPSGATVYVLGGTASIGDEVVAALTGAGLEVRRLAGADRYATAVAVADAIASPTGVLLATGLDFPDALAAGVAAAHGRGVVLFTRGTTQAPATQAWLDAHPAIPRLIVGGSASGSVPGTEAVVGADRYETATKLATRYFGSPAPAVVGLASGVAYPDALSGGPHIARLGGPVLLTQPGALPSVVVSWLTARSATTTKVLVFGGPATITPAVEAQVKAVA